MKKEEENTYVHDGKTVKIIPMKKVKKTEVKTSDSAEGEAKPVRQKKTKEADAAKGKAKYAVGDKVSMKNIPLEYAGAGFAESVIIKVFKSTYDQMYRYSIRSVAGHELPLLKEEQLKPRK